MAATSMHDDIFLIPKNVTSERPIALMPMLIRWWEAVRAPEHATDGRHGGAQQTVWEILMEMERLDGKAKEEDQGALALVLDLAKAFERVSFLVVWAWATHQGRSCGCCVVMVSRAEVKNEETDGSCCGQKEHDVLFFV